MITKHKNTRDSITYITLLLLVVVLSCKPTMSKRRSNEQVAQIPDAEKQSRSHTVVKRTADRPRPTNR